MKKLLIFAFAVFAFAACTQNDVEELSANRADVPETLTVGFEGGDDTRIQLNEAQKTVWTKDDLVSVFYRSNANQKWQYQGETGERVGNLRRVSDATATETMHRTVVVYPYNENYYINPETYNIDATLPAVQHYAEESYGVGENLMVSQSEFTQFSLKSVCGWLKIQLTGNGEKVTSLTLRGNNEEQLAGLIYVDTATAESTLASEMGSADDNNAGGNLIFDNTIVTELTLDCGEGVVLGAEATAFYIAVPPQTFVGGFTVDVECEDYEPMIISTENSVTIQRNTIQPMASITFEGEEVITYNEIRYTATAKVEANSNYPWTFDTFGANVVSHEWDSESGEGVITFNADVTTIGDWAFYYCSSLTSITIGDSVTTIGHYAFYKCTSLISVTIGDSVTTIGEAAFAYCYNLTSITIPDSITTIGGAAFYDCDSLTSVYCEATTPPSLDGSSVFDSNASGRKIYVPAASVEAYKTDDYWSKYADYIVGYDFENGEVVEPEGNEANRKIHYTATAKVEWEWTSDTFGANIVSNEWNSESGKGVITFDADVTTIGSYAFYHCSSLTSITIPDSVTTIGYVAFYYCTSLTSITIPDSVTTIGDNAFYRCSNLTSITIPDSVTAIGCYAFYYCSSLTSVTIPDSVTTIGELAFYDCTSLTSVTIPDSVTTIGEYAFSACTSLTNITIPDSVTTIGGSAFYDCDSLTSVTIGDSVTTIGMGVFELCTSLTSVYCEATTPPSLGGGKVFDYNASGRKIYVPAASVEAYKSADNWSEYADAIVGYDFENGEVVEPEGNEANRKIHYTATAKVEAHSSYPWSFDTFGANVVSNEWDSESGEGVITFDADVTTIGNRAFFECHSLTSITIPDSVTTIGKDAFNCCFSLTSVTIPDSVTTIEYEAFAHCYGLTSITIPDSVTTIGKSAFYDCNSLTSITIPDSVTTIGEYAFADYSSLTSVYCKATTPPSLGGSYVFDGNPSGRKIYVPAASVEAYKTAEYWSEYASHIVGYDFENGVVVE